jgi:hypothetical protein
MFHCGGGQGCGNVKLAGGCGKLGGKRNCSFHAGGRARRGRRNHGPGRSAAYPSFARYRGSGSIDSAKNFSLRRTGAVEQPPDWLRRAAEHHRMSGVMAGGGIESHRPPDPRRMPPNGRDGVRASSEGRPGTSQ